MRRAPAAGIASAPSPTNGSAPTATAPRPSVRRRAGHLRDRDPLAAGRARNAASAMLEERTAVGLVRGQQVEGGAEALGAHARVPTNSWVSPPESWSRRAEGNPDARSIRSISSGGGRYAIDLGR